jgi:cytochrome P450
MIAPGFGEFERAFGLLDRLVEQIVSERLANPVDTGDLVSALMLNRDEDAGHTMNANQVRDEILTAFQAGHEPMAIGLTWACYLLSKYPATRVELQQEARRVLGGRIPSMEDLPKLTLNRMVIEETMRLLPPAWGIDRKAAQADELGGYAIPAGTIVGISSYVVHHLPAYWKNPEGFDPLRFTPENSAGRPTYAYLPFGGGPRRCIGFRFAMMQMQVILAALIQQVDLDLVPGPPVTPVPRLNLIPSRDFMMTVQPIAQRALA